MPNKVLSLALCFIGILAVLALAAIYIYVCVCVCVCMLLYCYFVFTLDNALSRQIAGALHNTITHTPIKRGKVLSTKKTYTIWPISEYTQISCIQSSLERAPATKLCHPGKWWISKLCSCNRHWFLLFTQLRNTRGLWSVYTMIRKMAPVT